jgi:hypothetical protein
VRSHKLNNTVYIQTPSSDNERGQDPIGELEYNQDKIAFRWNEGPKTVGALLMEADNDKIKVTLLDRNGQAKDMVAISK